MLLVARAASWLALVETTEIIQKEIIQLLSYRLCIVTLRWETTYSLCFKHCRRLLLCELNGIYLFIINKPHCMYTFSNTLSVLTCQRAFIQMSCSKIIVLSHATN